MRLLLIIFVFLLVIIDGFSQPINAEKITVVTYNIWFDNPNNTDNPWPARKTGVKSTLLELQPDIFCVQEALDHQVRFLEFGKYKSFGVGRENGKKAGEYSAIFYETKRFEKEDGGNFWLSETPDSAGSRGWDAACVRIVSWLKLTDKKTGNDFFVFNTHFDHIGDTARMESAKLLMERIAAISGNYPVILTGDFNCKIGSEPYQILTSHANDKPLTDARYEVKLTVRDPGYSFVGSSFKGIRGDIIDHIFISENFKVLESRIENNCSDGSCPSDHLPVVAILGFEM